MAITKISLDCSNCYSNEGMTKIFSTSEINISFPNDSNFEPSSKLGKYQLKDDDKLQKFQQQKDQEVEDSMKDEDDEENIIFDKLEDHDHHDHDHDYDPIMDSNQAWVQCFCCFIMNACTWGLNANYSIYLSYYLNEGMFNGNKYDFAIIGGLAFGSGVLFSPGINYIQGKLGANLTIVLGSCIQFLALILASFTTRLWQLYLTQGLLQSIGMAIVSVVCQMIPSQYFKKKRILANGIATGGSGVGGILFTLTMRKILQKYSVFWALRASGIISFSLMFIPILLIRSRSKHHQMQFKFFDPTIYKSAAYWLISVFVITCMFGYVVVFYTLANFATTIGLLENQGAIVSTMVQIGSTIGRPLCGFAGDIYGPITVAIFGYALSGVLCLAMWIPARSYPVLIIFGLIVGLFIGSIFGILSTGISTKTFGIKKMPNAFSNFWAMVGAAGIASPVIGLQLKTGAGGIDDPKQYLNSQIFSGVCFIVCATFLLFLRGYIKARDHILDSQEDSDKMDYTLVKVPFLNAISSCFSKSHEKT